MEFRHLALAACLAVGSLSLVRAEEQQGESAALKGQEPVMVSLTDREAPSDEEWQSLHEDTPRALFSLGGLSDLRSRTITFMESQYFTPNAVEGTLSAYGKMDSKNRFDRYSHIKGIEFDVPANTWKERFVMNAAALVKLTGKGKFEQYAGVELDTAVSDRRQIEVTFVGTLVPKDEAIRRLNLDLQALEYLGALHEKRVAYEQKGKLLPGAAPPAPKIVLANVMMLDRKTAKNFEGELGGKVETVIHGIGGDLRLVRKNGEESTLLTPVVRCHRTYAIEFRTTGGKLERVVRKDADGVEHRVPIVFDLTPDL